MDNSGAAIYLLIEPYAALFTETPALHVFFQSVFHTIRPPTIKEIVGRAHHSLGRS